MQSGLIRFKFEAGMRYCVFDFETCNLNLMSGSKNYPWQIYFLICEGESIIKKQNYYVKWPGLKVGADAAKITHFNPQIIEEHGVEPKVAMDDLDSYIYNPDYYVVGHNVLGFDACVHNISRVTLGLKTDYSWLNRLLDTNCIARGWKNNQPPKSGENLLAWQFRMNSLRTKGIKTSLGYLGKELEIPHDPSRLHDASVDVPLGKEVFKRLLYKIDI